MTLPEAQAWCLIITTTTTAVGIIAALFGIGKVHTLVNSAMTQEKAENTLLRSMLVVKQLEIDMAEKTRTDLAKTAALIVQAAPSSPEGKLP